MGTVIWVTLSVLVFCAAMYFAMIRSLHKRLLVVEDLTRKLSENMKSPELF